MCRILRWKRSRCGRRDSCFFKGGNEGDGSRVGLYRRGRAKARPYKGPNGAFRWRNPLLGGAQRQASPGVEEAEKFAQDVESIAGGAPPMSGIKAVAGGGTDDGATSAARELLPEFADAARVSFGGDDDYRGSIFAGELPGDGTDFIGGVVDPRLKQPYCARRHSFVDQDTGVEEILAGVRDAHRFERGSGFFGPRQPDLWCVALAIQPCSLDGAHGHAAAEDDDRVGFLERIFHH